ncbi:GNAT family N-acetyltransferase [Lacimicrobium sp. SS2-24]|uniref:GNAT family N-acetyltransferase n=1 Tax=Lacimicrobium sp. SS2-24 TaxID=2005569 RepID=UPI000B4B5489|nr:GNAT family N-acetyltransferase [Lacimicrobium sp. SS2-24]
MTERYQVHPSIEALYQQPSSDLVQCLLPDTPVFLRPGWFEIYERYAGQQGDTRVLSCKTSAGMQYAFFKQMERDYGLFSIRHLNSMSNYYSPMFDVFCVGDIRADYSQLVRESLTWFKKFDTITLFPLTIQQADAWRVAFDEAGFSSHIYDFSVNWFHDDIADTDSFWASRSSRLKNTIKRKRRKMEKAGDFSFLVTDCSDNDIEKLLADYHQVYNSSWKHSEASPDFIDHLCRYQYEKGELRIGIAYHQSKPIAAQLWFVNGKTAYIYKLAYDEDYSKFSAGTVLSAELFNYVIAQDKVAKIDFLTGADNYKQDWMSASQKLYGLQVSNSLRPAGLVYTLYNQLSAFKKSISSRG